MGTPTEILTAAQSLIRDPRHWIGGDLEARGLRSSTDYDVSIVSVLNDDGSYSPAELWNADCFCAGLALTRACIDADLTAGPTRDAAYRALNTVVNGSAQTGISQIGRWNDRPTTTHAEVMAAFDDAISRASA